MAELGQQGTQDAQLAVVLTTHAGVSSCPGAVCAILRTSEAAASLPSIAKPTRRPEQLVEVNIRFTCRAGPLAIRKPGCQAVDLTQIPDAATWTSIAKQHGGNVCTRQPRWQQ